MNCIYAYTPAQNGPELVPYVNISQDDKGDVVITVRQKGEQRTSTITIPKDEGYSMGDKLIYDL